MADLNQMAHRLVEKSTEPEPAESRVKANGRKGGLKGGAARAQKLTAEQRSAIARAAAEARWAKAQTS